MMGRFFQTHKAWWIGSTFGLFWVGHDSILVITTSPYIYSM